MKTRISTPWPLTGRLHRLAKVVFLPLLLVSALSVTTLHAADVSSYALGFDGTNGRVQVGNILSNVVNNFTIELWAYPTGHRLPTLETNGGISFIDQRFAVFPEHGDLSYGEEHAGAGLSIGANGISVYEHAAGYLPSRLVYSNAISGWTHVALVYSNKAPHLYVNGSLVRSINVPSVASFVHPGANLGGSIDGIGYGNYEGQLDEVRIWNAPLSQAQIQTNMHRTLAGDETNLVVYFRCDEGTGLALTDHAPAGPTVNGTLTNGTAWVLRTFTDIGAGLPGLSFGSVSWGDYDNDGRLDILLTGAEAGTEAPRSQVWRNTSGGFSNPIDLWMSAVSDGSAAWGDYNNDGLLDIAITGFRYLFVTPVSAVFQNTNGLFHNVVSLTPVGDSSVAWGDYDNDGRLDLVLTGDNGEFEAEILTSQVFRNFDNSFANINPGLPGVSLGSVAWGDYDNDGRLDILLTGITNTAVSSGPISQIWRNTGSGFTNINAGLPPVAESSVAWGDYDNDGRLDILLAGGISQVWRNTGTGFTNINANLPGVLGSSVAWGDYDNDGRLDFLLAGRNNGFISQIWRNTGSGFVNINAGLPGVGYGSVAWGDYDNDGRLDILLMGSSSSGRISQIWRNNTALSNSPPTVPTGLHVAVAGDVGTFTWNATTDAQTPASGLTYNLRVGTTPGGGEIVGPMAANNGLRRLPRFGNAQHNLSRTISGLPLGRQLYWSVQAVDSAFAGSPFAAETSFTLNTVFTPPNGIPVPGDINGDGVVDQAELDTVHSSYFSDSPFLQMTNVAGLGGTNVTFALSNSLAGAFSVEYTTNLMDWLFLGPATPRYEFTDTNAPAEPQRYYRLRWP